MTPAEVDAMTLGDYGAFTRFQKKSQQAQQRAAQKARRR